MTTLTPQQLIAAQQANLDAFFGVANKAFAGFEKLVALNLQVGKAALAESQDIVTQAISAGNPGALLAVQTNLTQPAAEKAVAYGRSVHQILSEVQSGISAAATAQGEQMQRDAQGFVESLKKSAPVGSESAISAWNSVFSAANANYESANKSLKQFVATLSTVQ
jgi:phasin family protein